MIAQARIKSILHTARNKLLELGRDPRCPHGGGEQELLGAEEALVF